MIHHLLVSSVQLSVNITERASSAHGSVRFGRTKQAPI
jgi:hypothetical protein